MKSKCMTAVWMTALLTAAALPVPVLAYEHSGQFYVTGAAGMAVFHASGLESYYEGQANYYRTFPGVSATADSDDSDFAFALGAGYQINSYVAVEGFYRSYGELKASVQAADTVNHVNESTTISAAGPGIGVLGQLPLTETFSLFLRADVVHLKLEDEYRYEDSSGNPPNNLVTDDANVALGFGLGGQYDFEGGYLMRVDYQHIRGEINYANGSTNKGDIDSFNLGVLKMF